MKTKEEIEQLAKKLISGNDIPAIDMRIGIKLGYAKCQENMADKKYTEEDIIDAINVGIDAEAGYYPDGWSFKLGISLEDYFINSLNKTNDK